MDTPIYDRLCAEQLFTPDPPSPPTTPVEWFHDVTDPQATGLMPAVKPSPSPREAP